MLLVFQIVFSAPVISWIESIYRGWACGRGWGGGGGWGAEGGVKQPFWLKEQYFAFSIWHKLIQSTGEDENATRSSLVPHAVLLMPLRAKKCILVAQQHRQKAICKSRIGHLWSSNWCFYRYAWNVSFAYRQKWISVDARRWSIFPKMVTFNINHAS